MHHPTRRKFLVTTTSTLALGTQALTACGGGSGSAAASADVAAVVSDTDSASALALRKGAAALPATLPTVPAPATGPLGVSIGAMQFTLLTSATSTTAPFCLGHAFKQGDVPAGTTIKIDIGTLQVTRKNSWSDGSLKFAILAGQTTLLAGIPAVVPLRKVSMPAAGAVLTTNSLKTTGITAQVGCGAFGTVDWATTDWDAPFMTWVSGPVMSSWIYRKPVGKDPHLVAWLEVRLFATGAVEVLPWIENGYILVPGLTNKNTTYTFSLGGTQRFSAAIDLKHHQRTPLVSGTLLSYWLGSDPGVTVRHDVSYLQATELVPSYGAQVSPSALAVTQMVASYVPLQQGNFDYGGDYMPGTGYHESIGLLPQHDVLYLVSNVAQAYATVVRNGYSAGRYPIHYRDEATQRPLLFSSYPTLTIGNNKDFDGAGGSTTNTYTPDVSGGSAPVWDVAHSPSVGYMAYLITGRFYFMEEVQFATMTNYLGNSDQPKLRNGSSGLVQTGLGSWQTRACAWDWRARVQALCATPDDDVQIRTNLIASVEANIDHFYGRYVAQQNNPYGWVLPGEAYEGTQRIGATWQQDFVTAAFGHSLSLGLPVSQTSATKLAAFFQWKAKSAVFRLGLQNGFWYINAATYVAAITPSDQPDYVLGTGPWYASDSEVCAASYLITDLNANQGQTEGVLAGVFPGETAYWGNFTPAIAYAVRFGVPGAQAAYSRMTSAKNYKQLSDAFNTNPVWGVRPAATTGLPGLSTKAA